jgi:RNA polymerase sigma-70 factor (ECF subfamily)
MTDPTANFVRLWTQHQPEVARYLRSMVPRHQDAAEILQDVSVRLWEKWDEYDADRPFAPWAIRFAYLEVLKWRQKQAREKLVFSGSLLEQIHARYEEEAPLMEARRRALTGCLGKLNDRQRELVSLRYSPRGSVKARAEEAGVSMHKLYYALEKIRARLLDCVELTLQREGWSDA